MFVLRVMNAEEEILPVLRERARSLQSRQQWVERWHRAHIGLAIGGKL